ncbi:squalene-hopene cyclase [Histoplasma capsulatum G186AR]|uniref:Terpene cyclase/mutase family member n=2 Tax=Ajellomyces capsulatus TaxID=5037 RepID=C0P0D4_AJECG|nr:squalene-hopene cyclase [Histoplasma capsulatum G186AR]EEH02950.1 squalene-hopene cyclase [Histoplasma capsulatum G186AR]KAG5296023.1 squalene-hopene cyclase [Histoplasma capsulatum]QSS74006.1 squalene-hopene cyclase [Histoplasma capsulatum G186AR]
MLLAEVQKALRLAVGHSLDLQRADGAWCGEVHSNATFTSQYVFLQQQIGLPLDPTEIEGLSRWLFSQQNEDGSWGLGPGLGGDVSTTTETYLALKILGVSPEDPRMAAARTSIIKAGSLPATRMFTRVFLASFGLIPWSAVPPLPAELILLPTLFPVNIYNLSSWARATCVPLLLIRHHEPLHSLPNGRHAENDFLDELWTKDIPRDFCYTTPLSRMWRLGDYAGIFFTSADHGLRFLGQYFHSPLRNLSRRKIINWILDHQEQSGEWAGYWPPQHNNIWALSLEGYSLDHPVLRRGIAAVKSFVLHDATGMRAQVTVSQVWDTALMSIALSDSAPSTGIISPTQAIDWLMHHEVASHRGDWRVLRPKLATGGFCFEEFNTLYPDVDDTAAVIMALIKSNPAHLISGCVRRAAQWILGMQNRDGGWGAFDWNNDKFFLNKIPFSDMDSLCDPSTPDVTGRIIECFGMMMAGRHGYSLDCQLENRLRASSQLAIAYLLGCQENNGSWWGRWGVNYLYGTSNVLCGLAYYYDRSSLSKGDVKSNSNIVSAVDRASEWLKARQHSNGGWGEGPESYDNAQLAGCGQPTASQSAWVTMALLNYLSPTDEVIQRGVSYLVRNQVKYGDESRATWLLERYTATGFPGHLYMEYDYYRHYFPIMALGRYVNKLSGSHKLL